ncbi:MAG: hypothetical protein AAGF88_03205 [Pseudomonadota bacterium]
MLQIDVLGARHGDCLVVNYGEETALRRILIDGGPPGVYNETIGPYLAAQRDGDQPPKFELAMVSHIDNDHIAGLIDLTKRMIASSGDADDPAVILRFWHNSFSDLTGGGDTSSLARAATAASSGVGFPPLPGRDHRTQLILASLNQGRVLRDNLVQLGLDGNRPFDGAMVMAGKSADLPDGMKITVIGPDHGRLEDLQQDWNDTLDPAEIAAMTDRSVTNLSSLVCLLEHDGHTILLTGDARGDDILQWLEASGLKQPGQPYHVDVLKMPHHGSDNNVDAAFFSAVTADTYIYCGNGHHDNPEPATIEMMRTARAGASYQVILSGPVEMQHDDKQPDWDHQIEALDQAGITVRARPEDQTHFRLIL